MRKLLIIVFGVMLVTSCVQKVKVQTDVDPVVDFSAMRTFGWLDIGTAPGKDVRVNNPELATIVRAAAEKNLLKKGFVKGENPDFLINWLGAIESKVRKESIDHFYSGYGYQTLSGTIPGKAAEPASVTSYEEGTIVIDILDPHKHRVLWRGSGKRRLLKDNGKDQAARYVNLSVGEILKGFPPAR